MVFELYHPKDKIHVKVIILIYLLRVAGSEGSKQEP